MGSRIRPLLLIVTAFWTYVTISNVLYANNMQASLTMLHVANFFAPWQARVVQHLLLYPALLACIWGSLRLGWQPIVLRLPVQALIGMAFAASASPALWVGLWGIGGLHHDMTDWGQMMAPQQPAVMDIQLPELPIWLASITNFLLTYGFALALVSGFDTYRRLRDSQIRSAALERALSAAHLASLRLQLSPHSLFNLLHTIRGQIEWDPAAARTMLVQLGELLRRLLHAGEREYSRLSDEMQFVNIYLELQRQRFADRLSIEVPSAAELPAAWVPSLILQPLVENAVVHGLAGHQGPVMVRVRAESSRGTLVLRVTNTVAAERAARAGGIGIRNVRDRLAIQFGERASFNAGADGEGHWVAEIGMPLLTDLPDSAPASERVTSADTSSAEMAGPTPSVQTP